MQSLEILEIDSAETADSAIIWLHGLGADGYDFEPVVKELNLPSTRFLLPHAPIRPITINNGYSMRGWYDLFGLGAGSPQDDTGIREMQKQIEVLITQEIARGIAAKRIVLAGFSQGGAMALHTALRYGQRLGAVVGLSTYLPLNAQLDQEAHDQNRNLAVFLAHGTFDNIITLDVAQASAACLRAHGYDVTWREYPMAHSVCMEEIYDIRGFLSGVLNQEVFQKSHTA